MNLVKSSQSQCTPWNKDKSVGQGLERYCNYRFNLLLHGPEPSSRLVFVSILSFDAITHDTPYDRPPMALPV